MNEADPQAAAHALIGRQIAGKLEIQAYLGGGGMGWVFTAYHHTLGKKVAIKVLKRKGDPLHAKRFEVEARSASRLEHPNVVRILDFGEDGPDRLVYLAMEFVEGTDLDRIIRAEAPLHPRRAANIMAQTMAALFVAHEAGVVHRDLKPANIMVSRRINDDGLEVDFAKVCDFGLAKLVDAGAPGQGLTRRGMIVGTPDYMSPEQAVGDPVDGRTDVYAAGIILYEMLTGRRPFEAKDPGDVLLMHLNDTPRPPRAHVPSIPKDLERIVLWAMEKRADRRAGSARELRDALKRFIERPDFVDVETVVNVSHLKAKLAEQYEASPESITDEVEVPVLDSPHVVPGPPHRRPDTLVDEPIRERATPQEIPIPRRSPTPRPAAPPPPEIGEIIAQDTLRPGLEELPEDAFTYEGPHPFFLLDPVPRRVGPCSYHRLDALLHAWLGSDRADEACISHDGERWFALGRYLDLTAQDSLLPGAIDDPAILEGMGGRLEEMSATAMLAALARERATGRMLVSARGACTEIFVREGQPVDVRSSHPDDQTPALLVSRGLLDPASLPGLVHTALATETRIDQILAGAIDLGVLREALFKERLLALLPEGEGHFVFDGDCGTPQGAPLAVSIAAWLPNLAYRALPTEALAEALEEHCDTQLGLAVDAAALLDLMAATPGQRALASQLGQATLRTVLESDPERRTGILPAVYVMLELGVLTAA